MFKRIMLALTFVGAFSVVGVGIPDTAEARGGWRRSYVNYSYGPPTAYDGVYRPNRTAFRAYHGQRNHGRFYQHRRHHGYAIYY